jgi:Chaperone of endosialidase
MAQYQPGYERVTRGSARRRLALVLAIALTGGLAATAWAQYQSATGKVVGTVGGACDSSSITYGWPDTNGQILKCVSNVWTLVTQPATAAGSNGQVQFNSSNALAGSANLFWDNTHFWLGIDTSAPDAVLSFGGQSAQTIDMLRETTSGTAGNNLTITAGGAVSGGTNLAGGSLVLSSGTSTGTGTSNVQIQTYPAGSTGTSDATVLTALTISATGATGSNAVTMVQGNVGSGTNKNGGTLTLASGVSTGTGTSGINFSVYGAGSSGSSANSATTAMTILGNGDVGVGNTAPTANLQIGDHTITSTATPVTVDLGGTYSNTAGANPKLLLWSDGPDYFGLGVSTGSFDFITAGSDTFQWYQQSNPTRLMYLDGSSLTLTVTGVNMSSTTLYALAAFYNTGVTDGLWLGADESRGDYNGVVGSIPTTGNNPGTASNLEFVTDDGTNGLIERLRITGAGTIDIKTSPEATEIANAGTTGTTQFKLAKLTGAPSTAIIAATTDTGGMVGIVVEGAGTTGSAMIATTGQAKCVFDGATTAGHYVGISSTTAGDCHDVGSTYPASGQILGRVLSTNGSGGTYAVALYGPEIEGASGGGSGTVSSGTQYQMAYYASNGTTISGDSNIVTDSSNNLQVKGGNISIGTTTVTNAINITGQSAQTISLVRETTAATAGNNLTVQAGGAISGGTNLAGGKLVLSSGTSTGTGTSNVQIQTFPAGSTGTGDATALTALTVSATGATGTNAVTTVQGNAGSGTNQNGGTLTLASGVSTGTGTSGINFNVYGAGSSGSSANSATTAMTILGTGLVGIGTTVPAYLLHVGSSSASGVVAELQNSSGACTYQPGASYESVSCSSDARLKKDIVDTGDMLAWLEDIRIRDFTVIADGDRRTGVIAQELLTSHPDMVHSRSDGLYTVEQPNPWIMVRGIQQLKTLVDRTLETVIAGLTDFGVWIAKDQTYIRTLMTEQLSAEHVIVGSHEQPSGITIYDRADGTPYCVTVYNGSLVTTKEACTY